VAKDYFNARSMYNQALKYKPNDALATNKINEINQTLERQRQQQQALAENDRKYNELVLTADNLLNAKDYVRAKSTYNMALALKPEQYPKTQIQKIDNILLLQEQQKQAELERENNFAQAISKADELYNKKDFYNAKEMYEAALSIKPNDNYSKTRVKNITAFLAKIEESQAKTDVKPVAIKAKSTQVLPELKFKDEAELELYKVELRKMYPEGITHEVYNAERQKMDRYIIIRKNETNDFRKISYSWGGTEHWINDKPCTSMYFNSQIKQRGGEYYNKVEK
jgi:tetratricopeptide (TPR) repeat protein